MPNEPLCYRRRGSDELIAESVLGGSWLAWAYRDWRAAPLRTLIFRCSWLSRLLGWYLDTPWSRARIGPTIAELQIDVAEFAEPVASYASFNAFFTRRLKPACRPCSDDPTVLVAPAEGRVLAYPIANDGTVVPVKGVSYTVDELLGAAAPEYVGGTALVIRLCPADYHRLHFPCAGEVVLSRQLPGTYHSVNPLALALGWRVFTENKRAYSILQSEVFGRVALLEVGAFGVGSIVWTFTPGPVSRMQERGYFAFGGSTMVLLLEPGRFRAAADLLRNTQAGYETLLRLGEELGTAVSADAGA